MSCILPRPLMARGDPVKGKKTYPLQTATCAMKMRPCVHKAHTRHMCHSSCHTCHHHAVLHAHAPRAGRVQCLDSCEETLVASRPPLIAWGFGHKMCARLTSCSKTVETTTCAVEARPYIHASRTWRAGHLSCHTCHHHAVLHAHVLRAGRVVFGLARCLLSGVVFTVHSV